MSTSSKEKLQEKYSNILKCPCEHETHKGEPHTQEEAGCPNCDIAHDKSIWFSNAEVKSLITKHEVEARKSEWDLVKSATSLASEIDFHDEQIIHIDTIHKIADKRLSELQKKGQS